MLRKTRKIRGGSGGNYYPLNLYENDPQVSSIGNHPSTLDTQSTYLNFMGGSQLKKKMRKTKINRKMKRKSMVNGGRQKLHKK